MIMILSNKNKNLNEFQSYKIDRYELLDDYRRVRGFSHQLAEPLTTEDYVIQTMPDVSPTKWHLAHTSWFFEAFVLSKVYKDYKSIDPKYTYIFNSYYVQVGERHCRPKRGLLSRPTVNEIYEYRAYVDENMEKLFSQLPDDEFSEIAPVIEIGIHHEQQHQELIVTDIKHVFSENPLDPVYLPNTRENSNSNTEFNWFDFDEGIYNIGNKGNVFGYDNEFPLHKTLIQPFTFSSRLITNGEYIEFIEDEGYQKTSLWLSDGWSARTAGNWEAPLYWDNVQGEWWNFTLNGFKKVDKNEPVCHVSYYEADAFATWAGTRLPTEFEWEVVSSDLSLRGNFAEDGNFNPVPNTNFDENIQQMYGDVWEWTRSPYSPYPGYKTLPGALGEYNGKFMCNQIVLKGGSCATSKTHIRNTYRNFFTPESRWQFMGIRLAKDVD